MKTVIMNVDEEGKVRIWNRVGFVLLSVLVGWILGSSLNDVSSAGAFQDSSALLEEFIDFLGFTAIFGCKGWLAWLVAFIWFSDARGRRFWGLLALGTLLGPLSLLVVLGPLITSPFKGDEIYFLLSLYLFAAMDAFITTYIYLFLLRWQNERKSKPSISMHVATNFIEPSLQ